MSKLTPNLTALQWSNTFAGMLCFTFSYGFIRSWPNLWTPLQESMSKTEIINGTEVMIAPSMDKFSITSGYMLNGLQIAAAFCGLILPTLGNRNATVLAGIIAILGYQFFPYALETENWTLLYCLCLFTIGIPMGVVNSAGQNNIKNTVSGPSRGFATTFAVAGNTVGHFCLPLVFDWYCGTFEMATVLKLSGVLFVGLLIAGVLMKTPESQDSENLSDKQKAEQAAKNRRISVMSISKKDHDEEAQMMIYATKEIPQVASKKLWLENQVFPWHIAHFCFALCAYFASLTFLPKWIEDQEIGMTKPEMASIRLRSQQILAITEAVGRFIGLCIVDKFHKVKILFPVYIALAIGWTVFVYGYSLDMMFGLPVCTVFYISMGIVGVATGCYGGTFFALAMDLLPKQKHAVGLSMSNLLSGLMNFVVIYIFGKLYVETNKDLPILLSSVIYLISAVLLIPVYLYREAGTLQEQAIIKKRVALKQEESRKANIVVDLNNNILEADQYDNDAIIVESSSGKKSDSNSVSVTNSSDSVILKVN